MHVEEMLTGLTRSSMFAGCFGENTKSPSLPMAVLENKNV